MRPAFLRVWYAPFLLIVLIACVESVSVIFLLSSGTKIVFFWRFGLRRFFPVGLYWVARVRLLYPPATFEPLFVMGQVFAMLDFVMNVVN